MDEKIRQAQAAVAEYDAAHPYWRQEARERREREDREAEERAQRAHEARRQAEQQRHKQVAASNTQAWCQWVDERIVATIKADHEALHDAIGQVISDEKLERRQEIKAAVDEAKEWIKTKLEGLEQRIFQLANHRVAGRDGKDADPEAVARLVGERVEGPLRELISAQIETRLTMLEERLKEPGQMPTAKTWRPQSVTYQSEFVSYEGSLYQAKTDTATTPGTSDHWVCVARAGRDGVDGQTPNICGTYNARKTYEELDMVALDGATFIAKFDNPGLCPGNGWQLMACQGKRGQRGERGEKGDRGPAVMPELVNSKIDENYNLTILRSDNSLEIIPLREAFERFFAETTT